MGASETGAGSGGEGLVESEGAGRPEHPDGSGDGTLRPECACADEGTEVALILVRAIKTRKGRTIIPRVVGDPEIELWEETQEYIPGKESHDDTGTTPEVGSGGSGG